MIFSDVGVMVLAVLNAIRVLKIISWSKAEKVFDFFNASSNLTPGRGSGILQDPLRVAVKLTKKKNNLLEKHLSYTEKSPIII